MTKTIAINRLHQQRRSLRLSISVVLMIAFFWLLCQMPAQAALPNESGRPQSFSALAAKVSPAVVNIQTVKTIKGGGRVFRHFFPNPWGDNGSRDFFERFFGPERQREYKQRSLGSGFIISPDGYIVTNNHVVEGADQIRVILKNEKGFNATVVGRDPNTDLALIKIKCKKPLAYARLGDSDKLNVGEWVVAIGSPFGLEQTVTAGIISAKGRVIGSGPYDDFLQTDASINPGNSGGPLLNMDGDVIGINTAIIASGQGIGFAIPINMAKGIINQLKQHGEVVRGWLGVQIQDLTDGLRDYLHAKGQKGALVLEVMKGDPAQKAGIKAKDIITEVNGKPIESIHDLTRIIADIPVGNTAVVKALRDGKPKTFKVKISKRSEERASLDQSTDEVPDRDLGIRVTEITPEMSRRYNLPEQDGVIVTEVSPESKADDAGLQTGDVILEINRHPIKTEDDYEQAIGQADKGIDLYIRRQQTGFMVIKIEK
jgi:serine protease Do